MDTAEQLLREVLTAFKAFYKEVQEAEGDYGIGLAMTKADTFFERINAHLSADLTGL